MADVIWNLEHFLSHLWACLRMYASTPNQCHGRRRSLIRLIGSALPLSAPSRMRLPQKLRKSFGGSLLKRNLDLHAYDNYDLASDSSSFVNVTHPKPDVVMDIYETPSVKMQESFYQEEKIISLEQQVIKLQSLVDQILLQQQNSRQTDQVLIETREESVCVNVTSSNLPPPPPPPLPPPPPALPNPASQLGLNISKFKAGSELSGRKQQLQTNPSWPSMGDVLKDLNKIKLRHVERSPGGRPIKRPASPTSPANCLAAVLRKRFAAIQTVDMNEADSDDSSSNSFHSRKEEASH